MKFLNFIGNERTKNQIAGQIDNNRLHNTIIIEGESGSGKKTFADIIAMAAVCTSSDEKPCRKCKECQKAISGNHPDILKFFPQDGRNKINAEETRQIREKAFVIPNEADKNIIIIESADKMEEKTQNMLLKVLEETPDRTTFILLCNSKENLLETVRSRGTVLSLGGVDIEQAARKALERCPKASEEDALLAAEISNGVIGEAISLLGDKKLKDNILFTADLIRDSVTGDYDSFISKVLSCEKSREKFKTVLEISSLIFKDALLISAGTGASSINDVSEFIADRLSKKQITDIYRKIIDILKKSEQNGNLKLLQVKYVILLKNRGEK